MGRDVLASREVGIPQRMDFDVGNSNRGSEQCRVLVEHMGDSRRVTWLTRTGLAF